MMLRRGLLGMAALPLVASRAGAAAPADIAFAILREGSEVGTHTVRFREDGDLLRARSEVRIAIRLAGFTVFRYAHDTEEAWRGERLVALNSRLDRNGRASACEARAEAAGLRLRGTGGEALLPPVAAPLTWWRAATLLGSVPLFDPRQGRPVEPELRRSAEAGRQRVTLVGGEGAEVLYDAAGRWIGFATNGEDGSRITYRRS